MFIALTVLYGCAAKEDNSQLRIILLDQLKNSYDHKNWYVSLKYATADLSAEQASWKDSTSNHSIAEIVSHLIFWNERNLLNFQGRALPDYSGDNKETFTRYTSEDWSAALSKLDSIQTSLYTLVEKAEPDRLSEWSSDVANISSHNAYHTGQILFIRKMKGWWEDGKGA
jgi:hypothetical protein